MATAASTVTPPGRSLAQRSAHALAWSYGGALARVLAQLLIQVLLARLLGPLAFGQASLVLLVLSIGWLLAEGGFGAALVQKAELHDEDIAFALGWIVLLSLAIGGAILLAAPSLAAAFGDAGLTPLFRASGLLVPLQALSNLPISLLRRDLRMKGQQVLQVGSYLLGMGVGAVGLAVSGWGAWSLVGGYACQTTLLLVGAWWLARPPLRCRLRGDAVMRRFGLSVMGTNIANWAIDNLDRLMVGRLWGQAALGGYAAMSNLARAPAGMLVSSLQGVAFPSAARAQHDRAALATALVTGVSLLLLVTGPLFCFAAWHADLVVHTLYGQRWTDASPLFAAFCATIPSYAVLAYAGPLLWGLGAAHSEMKIQAAMALVPLIGFALLARWPLAWAVWLVPALYFARAVLVVRVLARQVGLARGALYRTLPAALGCTLLVCAASVSARGAVADAWGAAIAAAAGALAACAVLLHVGGHRLLAPELQQLLRQRAVDSAALRRLCRLLGLEPRA